MLDSLNQYSNLIIALATVVNAFLAGVIWRETKKYRKITEELKEINRKIVQKDELNLKVDFPDEIRAISGSNKARFRIPIWVINLSNKPNSLLHLEIKVNKRSVKACNLDSNEDKTLDLPLEQAININSWSSSTFYVEEEIPIGVNRETPPHLTIEIWFKHLGGIVTNTRTEFKIDGKDNRFCLVKIVP